MYEGMAAKVADAYLEGQVDPNVSIALLARGAGFSAEQIHRVVELSNHQINATMSKTSSDQLFTFPVATVEGVVMAMGLEDEPQDLAKQGSDLLDFGAYHQLHLIPDYVQILVAQRTDRPVEVVKTAELEPEPNRLIQENQRVEKLASLAGEIEYLEAKVRSRLHGVKEEWGKLASEEDQVEFLAAAICCLGGPAVEKLAEDYGAVAKGLLPRLEHLDVEVTSGQLDQGHPIVQGLMDLNTLVQGYRAKEAEHQKLAGVKDMAAKILKVPGHTTRQVARATGKGVGLVGATARGAGEEFRQMTPLGLRKDIRSGVVLGTAVEGAKNLLEGGKLRPGAAAARGIKQGITSPFLERYQRIKALRDTIGSMA